MDAIIEAAAAADARLVFGDNLYPYGPVDGPLTEDLPYLARGSNGRTRARMAETLMRAHEAGRIQTTIGRGSDFFVRFQLGPVDAPDSKVAASNPVAPTERRGQPGTAVHPERAAGRAAPRGRSGSR
jgi:hypothetical protein